MVSVLPGTVLVSSMTVGNGPEGGKETEVGTKAGWLTEGLEGGGD